MRKVVLIFLMLVLTYSVYFIAIASTGENDIRIFFRDIRDTLVNIEFPLESNV